MPHRIPQSIAIRVPLKAYLAVDHTSDATGLSPVITISKNGAAFGNPSAGATVATEIGNGWYYVDLSTTDIGSLGPIVIRAVVTTMDNIEIVYQIVDPYTMGASALPDALPGSNNGLTTTNGTKQIQTVDLTASQSIACSDKTGFSLSATGADLILKSSTFVQAIVAALNELATYGLTALNTLLVTTGIKAASVPALVQADVRTAIGLASANLDTQLAALPTDADVNAACDTAISDAAIPAGVRTNLATELGRIDAAISTRTKPADTQARVALVDVTTLNSDMRGTDGAITSLSGIATATNVTNAVSAIESYGDSHWAEQGSLTKEAIRAEIDANSTQLAAIIADTNELQTDWHNGGRLDLILDSVVSIAGTNAVTITVNDGTNPIADVEVAIYDSTNLIFVTGKTTIANGTALVYLDDGAYKIRLRKTGASFTNPESLTVSGITAKTCIGTIASVGLPADSDACRVYEYCYDQAGATPLATVTATAIIKSKPYDYDDKLHSVVSTVGTYSAITGLVYWDVVKGADVLFEITEMGSKVRATIPNLSTARLSDLG